MIYPVAREYEDPKESKKFFLQAKKHKERNNYIGDILAIDSFGKSLGHQFVENESLGHLVYLYAKNFKNVSNTKKAKKVIFKLVEIARAKRLNDINLAMGTALFYAEIGKIDASIKVINNYLRLNKPSTRLYAHFLEILMKKGTFTEANKVFERLVGIKRKGIEVYLALIKYHIQNEEFDKAIHLSLEAGKKFPKSVPLLMILGDSYVENKEFLKLKKVIQLIKELQAEQSPVYYAKYLEFKGYLSAAKQDTKSAVAYFKKSLKYFDSTKLRGTLSLLSETDGTKGFDNLVLESRIKTLIVRAKEASKLKDWEKAFKFAIDAADLSEDYVPSRLLLADIQIERGYFDSAINTLKYLKKKYPMDSRINYSLINAYVQSYKLNDAKQELSLLSQTKFQKTPEYALALGKYYLKKENYIPAVKWIKEAIKRDPVNDQNYYYLARIYFNYKKFKESKVMLNKAISLDPISVTYKSLYAAILYEIESADAAIGYLLRILEDNKDDPLLLGDIATYYNKNGKVKEFERYKKIIDGLNRKNEDFYRFLIKNAKLEDRLKDVLMYSKELIKINPGDLETRMKIGEYLFDYGKTNEALIFFKGVRERLGSYPRINYHIAKCYLISGNLKAAEEFANNEIKFNSRSEYGHYALGEIYKIEKKYSQAQKKFEKAISINGKYVEALVSLAWIKRKQNNLEQARELLLRALKEDVGRPEVHRELGYVYKDIGQSILARESFETYLKMRPAAKDLKQIEIILKRL